MTFMHCGTTGLDSGNSGRIILNSERGHRNRSPRTPEPPCIRPRADRAAAAATADLELYGSGTFRHPCGLLGASAHWSNRVGHPSFLYGEWSDKIVLLCPWLDIALPRGLAGVATTASGQLRNAGWGLYSLWLRTAAAGSTECPSRHFGFCRHAVGYPSDAKTS